jgi:hypothetical protein
MIAVLLSSCLRPAPDQPDPMPITEPPPSTVAPTPTDVPVQPTGTATPDPALPVVMLEQALDVGTFYLIRYQGPQGLCICPTFNPRILEMQRCGTFSGAGVGFVDEVTDPGGGIIRVAYGMSLDNRSTAVAVEFASGGNGHVFTENNGYALILEGNQTPRRATAIDQYGNMVGQWTFSN